VKEWGRGKKTILTTPTERPSERKTRRNLKGENKKRLLEVGLCTHQRILGSKRREKRAAGGTIKEVEN